MLSKSWTINKGAWDGNLLNADADGYPDWFHTARHVMPTFDAVNPSDYAGTGPYMTTVLDGSSLSVLDRNVNYWQGWPAGATLSDVSGVWFRKSYLEHVNIEYLGTWAWRRDVFTAGQFDTCLVPRNYIGQLLNSFGDPLLSNIKTIKNVSPYLAMDAFFFVFTLNQSYSGIGLLGKSPTGIPFDFFNNTHVRKAFGYSFNRTTFILQGWNSEAMVRDTPGIAGLAPDYYTYGPNPPWAYDINETALVSELQAATFTQGGVTKSVWDWGGFKVDLYCFRLGGTDRIQCECIKAEFNRINSVYGKNFQANVVGLSWSNEINLLRQSLMPTFSIGWLADYADASNWYGPYMGSNGDFSGFSNYTVENGWGILGSRTGLNKEQLLTLASQTQDGPQRAAMYADLDDIYVQTIPSLPTAQPVNRRWCQYWVKGWEYNPIWPSDYYRLLYKENGCWGDVNGAISGVGEGMDNMRDIGYIAAKFGARAPDTSKIPAYDPKWGPGAYGTGCADVYGDRKVDMRDIGFAISHFLHYQQP